MEDGESLARAKSIMIRVVSDKIPKARGWPVSKEYKSWIESLSDDAFKDYLDRVRVLTRSLSNKEMPKGKGAFIMARSYPLHQAEMRDRLHAIGGEATAYYALALWRDIQAENLLRELDRDESKPPE